MNRPCAPDAGFAGLVVGVEGAALLAAELVGSLVGRLEAETLLEESSARIGLSAVSANRVEALEGELGRDLRMLGDQGGVVRPNHGELEIQALEVGEAQAPGL